MPSLLSKEGTGPDTEDAKRKASGESPAVREEAMDEVIAQINTAMYTDYPYYQTDDASERASDLMLCHEIRRDVETFLRHLELGGENPDQRDALIEAFPVGPNRVACEIAFHMHDLGITVSSLDSASDPSTVPSTQVPDPSPEGAAQQDQGSPTRLNIMSVEQAKEEMKKRLTAPGARSAQAGTTVQKEGVPAPAAPLSSPNGHRYKSACQHCETCLLRNRGVIVSEESGSLYRIGGCTLEVRAFVGHLCKQLGFEQLPDDAVAFIEEGDNPALDQYTHDPSLIVANNVADKLGPFVTKGTRRKGNGPEMEEYVVEIGVEIKDAVARFVFASSSGKERVAVNYSVGKANQIPWDTGEQKQ